MVETNRSSAAGEGNLRRSPNFRGIGIVGTSIVVCLLAGGASAILSPRDGWYDALAKPSWMPPPGAFGIAWTILYILMGASIGIAMLPGAKPGGRPAALRAFIVQLLLNVVWCPVFFRYHSIGGALLVLAMLWLAVAWTVAAIWSVRDLAGVMLLPYWAWVTFALALNGAIWRMN